MKKILCALVTGAVIACAAWAERPDDGIIFKSTAALQGKKVAYLPIVMGLDITEAWVSGLRKDAEEFGYELLIRDPNSNVDAGSQALTQLIQEKPDIIVIHPPEMQVYARLIQRAERAGISVVIINLKASNNTDYYIGTDWYGIAEQQAKTMVQLCGKTHGGTGKVAVMQGVLTNSNSQYGIMAINDVFAAANGDVELVSNQSADWEANKARTIAATVLQANPDLCGYIGMWDGMDVGIAAAIREAGKQDQVKLISNGGGNQDAACNLVENGGFTAYISYQANLQARDLRMAVRALLQNPPAKPGENPIALYSPLKSIDKTNLRPGSCWNLETLRSEGP